jgi:hypothetical protein
MGPAAELGLLVGIAMACAALGVARASFYRARRGLAPKVVAHHPRHVLAPGRVKGGSGRESVVGCGGCADAAGVDTTTT